MRSYTPADGASSEILPFADPTLSPMLTRYRKKHPGSSLASLFFFDFCREGLLVFFNIIYRLKRVGVEHVPAEGGVLMVANHQSFFDPPAIAIGVRHRQADFLARGGLFNFKPFGWLIKQLHAMPIKQGAGDAGAMKATIQRLNDGKMMIVFPEGARTSDGEMLDFQRGIAVLIKRANCQIVPVGIAGAFDAWPRTKKLPRLFSKRIVVCYGEPIDTKVLMEQGTDEAISTLYERVHELVGQAQSHQ